MEKIIPIQPQEAFAAFEGGTLCSQQCAAFGARLAGADPRTIQAAMLGFARGLGDRSRTCGCLTGALAGLGLMLANASPETRINKLRCLQAQMEEDFARQFGGTTCISVYTDRPHCCEMIGWVTQRLVQIAGQI